MSIKNDKLYFVVHLHDATRLHFDLRLQIGSVMPSWAVPKGPSLDNNVKRLAMETTDHTIEYRNFEGVLPEGSVGAGSVMIWDEGYYVPEVEIAKGEREIIKNLEEGQKIMQEGLKKGEIKFFLHGKKLKGSFALVKTRNFGPKNSWLLIKHKDKYVVSNFDPLSLDKSAKTNKTLEQIRGIS